MDATNVNSSADLVKFIVAPPAEVLSGGVTVVEFSLFATVVIDQIWKLRNFTWSKLTEISRLELPAKLLEYIESLAWSRQEQH